MEVEHDQSSYIWGATAHDTAKLTRGADKDAVVCRIDENCDSNGISAWGHGALEEDVDAAGLTTIGGWLGTRCGWTLRGWIEAYLYYHTESP